MFWSYQNHTDIARLRTSGELHMPATKHILTLCFIVLRAIVIVTTLVLGAACAASRE
jgi:hypothetical protein